MCMSSPSIPTPVTKDPVYMRNPYLDGLALNASANTGRNSLRIDKSTDNVPRAVTPAPGIPAPRMVGVVVPNTQPGTAAGARQALTIGPSTK
jgi:hypothetical protein